MKSNIFLLTIILFFSACTFSVGTKKNNKNKTGYYCPMECEKTKTYTKQGSCPVCKMDLEKGE